MKQLLTTLIILWSLQSFSQCDSIAPTTHDSIYGYQTGCRFSFFGFKFGCSTDPVVLPTSHDTIYSVDCPSPTADTINFGIFVDNPNISIRISEALRILGPGKTIRYNYFPEQVYRVQQQHDAGLKVHMFYGDTPVNQKPHFINDTNVLKARLNAVFSTGHIPEWCSLNNEYSNQNYYAVNDANLYLKNLKAFVGVCHSYGIKCGDGGATANILYKVFEYYRDEKTPEEFAWFKAASGITNVNGANAQKWVNFWNIIIPGLAASEADYVAIHWQELHGRTGDPGGDGIPLSDLFPAVVEFMRVKTGKPVYLTEFACDNDSPEFFNRWMDQIEQTKIPVWIYFFGDGPSAVPQDDTYSEWIENYEGSGAP